MAWVSLLVVHQTYRSARIATRLLYSVWQFSDCYAWGLATANPLAVRALETATRRPCRARYIGERDSEILRHVRQQVEYLPDDLQRDADGRPTPRVDTQFFLDHGVVPGLRNLTARGDRPWALGEIDDGEEWLACTFRDQPPQAIDDERQRPSAFMRFAKVPISDARFHVVELMPAIAADLRCRQDLLCTVRTALGLLIRPRAAGDCLLPLGVPDPDSPAIISAPATPRT